MNGLGMLPGPAEARHVESAYSCLKRQRIWGFLRWVFLFLGFYLLSDAPAFPLGGEEEIALETLGGILCFPIALFFFFMKETADDRFENMEGRLGRDLADLYVILGVGPLELPKTPLKKQRSKADDVLREEAERLSVPQANSHENQAARKRFGRIFDLFKRFGLVDGDEGWGPYFVKR